MKKTAIILGATGLTGNLLLKKLLKDDAYSVIKVFGRNPLNKQHTKIKEYIGDLFLLESFEKDFTADEVFCCIGTTAKKTPDKDLYKKIDLGIPVLAAKLCKRNKISTLLVISSMGANKNSKVFYSRTKGEMEEAVLKEQIKNTYILRPSMILGDRNEKRLGESFGKVMMKAFDFLMLGKFKKYRAIQAIHIADAMIRIAALKPETRIVESNRIEEFAKK